ncbi:ammonia-dependent NAD(+) synthetase [Nocardiopsis coralliicola]
MAEKEYAAEVSEDRRAVIRALQVAGEFHPDTEIERRVAFLAGRLETSGGRALILGISGGVDSSAAGRLCQMAVERLRERGGDAEFIAMRLPYGVQKDEDDAQLALRFVRPDTVLTVDVQPATDGLAAALDDGGVPFANQSSRDFVIGNAKARERMAAQYGVAGAVGGLVVGTDHAAEAVTGFFTKFGDGAADVVPLTGLTKRRVRAIAERLGAPDALVNKTPTADLESLSPQKSDEDALGLTYAEIDDFLEGLPVDPQVEKALLDRYRATAHKRSLPIAP